MIKVLQKITLIIGVLGFTLTANAQIHYTQMMNDPSYNFYDVCDAADAYFETHDKGKGTGWKPYQRWKYDNESKYYPSGDRSKSVANFAAQEFKAFQIENKNQRNLYPNGWKELGPWSANNITHGYNPGIGRVESFWVNPVNTQHLYLGSRSGGFWKSSDGGANWINSTDTLLASGVNTIAVNPLNEDSVLINVRNSYNGATHGIYRSIDGGINWVESNFNPTTLSWGGLGTNDQIYKIAYHPRVKDLVFIGTSKGIYRSDDDLQTWTQLLSNGDFTDIEFHPTNDSIIYLYDNYYWGNNKNKIMRSLDQGLTYSTSATISGNNDRKGFIAVTPMAPDNVYFASTNGVWKSNDLGLNYTFLPNPDESCDGFSVSDIDTNDMVYGYLNLMGSTDGGLNFVEIMAWANSNPTDDYTHADLRTAECINGVFYVGTDGYLAKTDDNGATWTRLNDGTSIREFYAAGVCQGQYDVFMAGSQDNGTSILNENGWIEWNGGDGMEAVVQTLNSDWMMGSWQYGTRQITKDGGLTRTGANNPDAGSSAWKAPMFYDPLQQMRVYHFSDKIYQTDGWGDNWYEIADPGIGTLACAAISENNSDVMAISSGSVLKLTTDGWMSIYGPNIGALPPYYLTDIAYDSQNDSTMVVTFDKYNTDNKKVYISHDQGRTWTNITYNLGDMPVRTVVIDHTSDKNIYIGTEIGVYVKSMTETTWQLYSTNFPNVTVQDLEIHYGSNTLKAATWGRGLLENSLKGRENYPAILSTSITAAPTSIAPRAGYGQKVTASVSYDQNLSSVFVKWANDSIDLYKTISMTNTVDSTWVSDEAFTLYGKGTDMYFKVFAVGQNNDTTETYRFHYKVQNGLNVNSVIENNFESEITLFPNPNSGQFKVNLGAYYENARLQVFDVSGKQVYSKMVNGEQIEVDFKSVTGDYVLQVTSDDQVAKLKFVIK